MAMSETNPIPTRLSPRPRRAVLLAPLLLLSACHGSAPQPAPKSAAAAPAAPQLAAVLPTAKPAAPARPPRRAPAIPLPTLRTDKETHPEADPPALPQAGARASDPVFGTPLLRVTDGQDGNAGCLVQYSYWPTFSLDDTHLLVLCQYGTIRAVVYDFDAAALKLGHRRALDRGPDGGAPLEPADTVWSAQNPDVLYGHQTEGARKLWSYNVATGEYVLLKDFSGIVPSGADLYRMSRSTDDDVFAAVVRDQDNNSVGYLVWRRSDDTLLMNVKTDQVEEVQIDKTGRYLTVLPRGDDVSRKLQIFDLVDNTEVRLPLDGNNRLPFQNYDSGRGILVSDNLKDQRRDSRYWGFRTLAAPLGTVIALKHDTPDLAAHFSLQADNEHWALVSTFRRDNGPAKHPFENEILQMSQTGYVRRIAHHYSRSGGNFFAEPHANISRDGQFVAFTSNWGHVYGRHDVYVAVIPPAPDTASPAPVAPAAGTAGTVTAPAAGTATPAR